MKNVQEDQNHKLQSFHNKNNKINEWKQVNVLCFIQIEIV